MRRLLFLCALTIGAAGCTVGPDYVKPEVDVPEDWRFEYKEMTGTVNTAWWRQFQDPVFDELIQTALENNKDVRIAAARVEEFAARFDIARAGLYPQVGYDGAAGRGRTALPAGAAGTSNTFQARLNVGWELDIWGRIERASEAVRADLLASEEGRRGVILTLVSAVATGYIELLSLDQQLAIAQRTLQARAETEKLFELKFQGGVVSELEVAQVRSEYWQAAVRIPALERQIGVLENALSVLLGRNPGPIPRGKRLPELTRPAVPAGVPSELLVRRPDILRAEQNLIAANAQIGVARSLYFPTISLTGVFGYASSDLSDLLTSGSNVWGLGGSLFGPIFSGGRISSQVRASEAAQLQALAAYRQTIQTAFREVDDALITTRTSGQELDAQGRRVKALEEYARYAELRYNEGAVSYLEVLDAERRLFDAELLYAQNQGADYSSLVNVYKAMGGGWVLDAEAVANQIDYPESEEKSSLWAFPRPTQPAAREDSAAATPSHKPDP